MIDFSEAMELANDGYPVRRCAWADNTFVFKQIPTTINVKKIVPKMQSMSEQVKSAFKKRRKISKKGPISDYTNMFSLIRNDMKTISFYNQFIIVDRKNNLTNYSPSASDFQATDWEEYEVV